MNINSTETSLAASGIAAQNLLDGANIDGEFTDLEMLNVQIASNKYVTLVTAASALAKKIADTSQGCARNI